MQKASNQRASRLAHCGKFLDTRKRTFGSCVWWCSGVPYSRHEFRIVRGWAGFADHQSPRRYKKRGKGGGGRYGADVLI